MKRTLFFAGAVSVCLFTSALSESLSSDEKAIITVVDGFHNALRGGDAKAAMEWLAPDAIILESGAKETRDEYEKHHLGEDIEFSRAVSTITSNSTVHVEGNAAWLSSTSRIKGNFHGRDVNSAGAELVVLTNSSAGWRIRAIHWSNGTVKEAN